MDINFDSLKLDSLKIESLKPTNLSSLDLSNAMNLASTVQVQFEENYRNAMHISEENYTTPRRMLQAMEETAANTAESIVQLQKIIAQQSRHIELLEKQLATQEKQLATLDDIFASNEDGVVVEKEIMKLIETQINESHPLWEYVKDKGGDIAVAGLLKWGPVIWTAVKMYLVKEGIVRP